ncbi:hypothetical protein [Alkalibaculum sporogenes]|nr:hypothetical protein [Alkalibaculum sporogenes]
MENDKTILELFDKLQQEELDFLPPDENVRKGFITFLKFMVLAS